MFACLLHMMKNDVRARDSAVTGMHGRALHDPQRHLCRYNSFTSKRVKFDFILHRHEHRGACILCDIKHRYQVHCQALGRAVAGIRVSSRNTLLSYQARCERTILTAHRLPTTESDLFIFSYDFRSGTQYQEVFMSITASNVESFNDLQRTLVKLSAASNEIEFVKLFDAVTTESSKRFGGFWGVRGKGAEACSAAGTGMVSCRHVDSGFVFSGV